MPPGYEHLRRWPAGAAQLALAQRLGLPVTSSMQDWEYEVADVRLLPALFVLADDEALTDDERFSLLEIIIQSVEMLETRPIAQAPEWSRTRTLLLAHPALHASTIWYWSTLEEADTDPTADGFRISSAMIELWLEILPGLPKLTA